MAVRDAALNPALGERSTAPHLKAAFWLLVAVKLTGKTPCLHDRENLEGESFPEIIPSAGTNESNAMAAAMAMSDLEILLIMLVMGPSLRAPSFDRDHTSPPVLPTIIRSL